MEKDSHQVHLLESTKEMTSKPWRHIHNMQEKSLSERTHERDERTRESGRGNGEKTKGSDQTEATLEESETSPEPSMLPVDFDGK